MKAVKKLTGLICLLVAFVLCLTFCGCEPVIYEPETLGEAEGLYLYKGNTRSLTDGSEQSEILTKITLDGIEYELGDFKIYDTVYATETHEIFYRLFLGSRRLIWHYNYETKTDGLLYELPENENVSLYKSKSYIFAKSTTKGVLFRKNTQIVGDTFAGFAIENDVLYRYSDNECEFWKDGKTSKVELPFEAQDRRDYYANECAYLWNNGKIACVRYEDCEILLFDVRDYVTGASAVNTPRLINETLYFTVNGDAAALCYIKDGEFAVADKFHYNRELYENEKTVASIGDYNNEVIKISIIVYYDVKGEDKSSFDRHTWYYDIATGEIKGSASLEKPPVKLTVGEYVFYVTKKYYGHPLWGTFAGPVGYYYYLNREKDGVNEVMQYLFVEGSDGSGYTFYNDICQF